MILLLLLLLLLLILLPVIVILFQKWRLGKSFDWGKGKER